jgi:Tat protein secretion system quality control protein TatD with DNase activity
MNIFSVNGCSLKTEENLKAAAAIRPEKIMLETGQYFFRIKILYQEPCTQLCCRCSMVFYDFGSRIKTVSR